MMEPLAAIVLVMALLGAALFVLKRRGAATFRLPGSGPRSKQMEVIDRTMLGPQHALHLVRVGRRTVLIATAPGTCQMLETLPEESV